MNQHQTVLKSLDRHHGSNLLNHKEQSSKNFTPISHIRDKMDYGFPKQSLSLTFSRQVQICLFAQKILVNLLMELSRQSKMKLFFLSVFNVCQRIQRRLSMKLKNLATCQFAAHPLTIALQLEDGGKKTQKSLMTSGTINF